MGLGKEIHMIDFSKTFPRTEVGHESRFGREQNLPDPLDLARQHIAARPTMVIAIAFAIGGVLGWLTSRK